MKLYNDQRSAKVFNLFIYLLLPYMFRAFFWPIFRGRYTNSAVVQASWVWCQRLGTDTIPRNSFSLELSSREAKFYQVHFKFALPNLASVTLPWSVLNVISPGRSAEGGGL
jgi:hypothetical protein